MNATSPDRAARRERWWFLVATIVLAFGAQWMRGLWEPDEGRYSECAREMVVSGDWLHPMLQGRAHLTKPPGAYWLIAVGLEVFGRNAFGARFMLSAAFVASAWTARALGRRLLGDAAGARAGWIFATMLYAVAGASVVSTDMFLATAVNAAVLCTVISWTSSRADAWLALAGAAWGAAFLIKGPPAFLPFLGFAIGWFAALRARFEASRIVSWGGTAAFLLVGLWWYLLRIHEEPAMLRYWLGHETLDRATTAEHGRNNPAWWYAVVIVVGAFPWTWLWMRGASRLPSDAAARAFVLWIGVPAVLFALFPSRMWLYLLPLAVPLALLAAAGSRRGASPLPAPAAVVAALCVLLVGGRVAVASLHDERDTLALADAARADGLPIALLSSRPMCGLSFHLDGHLRLLDHPQERRDEGRWDERFADWIDRVHATGQDWTLVVEPGTADEALRARKGDVLQPRPAPEGWLIYRVRAR
jgi:4-amino-4-deoxy-L-arabinose transferase-like glycosyltransferase